MSTDAPQRMPAVSTVSFFQPLYRCYDHMQEFRHLKLHSLLLMTVHINLILHLTITTRPQDTSLQYFVLNGVHALVVEY